jgi:hypothetical protein
MEISGLVEALKNRNIILFAGSGVSNNLELPLWKDLIDHIAKDLGYHPEIYSEMADHLMLAEYYLLKRGTIGPLRSWMDTEWHKHDIKIEDSKIHEQIVKLDFPIIYTTNYDRWIERAYDHYEKPYVKIIDVHDFVKVQQGTTQIIKFHGDFDDDPSIVLAESSYFDRLGFSSPLDIKLKHDLIGKSVLFIGYSLTDINVRVMLYQIHKMWDESKYAKVRPKSFMFLTKPNIVFEQILEKRNIFPIISKKEDPGKGLESFLQEIINSIGP